LAMRGHHDIGGLDLGPIDRSEHDYALWEKRVDAIVMLLGQKGVISIDEHRFAIETMGAEDYERATYYERWMMGLTQALLARGIVTTDELGRKMADIAERKPS
jgi:nitrile hydratase beta subunit-like protein